MAEYNDTARYDGDVLVHKQLHDFARDIVRVTNPTSKPFIWKHDGRGYVMQPGEMKDKERYWTDHYAKKLAEQVIGDLIMKQGEQAIIDQSKGNSDILYDKYIESMRVWERIPRKDDQQLLTKVMKTIVVGLVSKYGADEVDFGQDVVGVGSLRDKSFEQQLLEDLSNRPLRTPGVAPESSAVIADDAPPAVTQTDPTGFALPQTVTGRDLESEVTQ